MYNISDEPYHVAKFTVWDEIMMRRKIRPKDRIKYIFRERLSSKLDGYITLSGIVTGVYPHIVRTSKGHCVQYSDIIWHSNE